MITLIFLNGEFFTTDFQDRKWKFFQTECFKAPLGERWDTFCLKNS